MTDFDTLMDSVELHREAIKKANDFNKAALFNALTAADITSVTMKFNGEGDEGQIEAITARAGDAHVLLPNMSVTLHRASWGSDALSTITQALHEAIETLAYDYLEQEHGGWENNEGGFGTFTFDVVKRAICLEFNGRYSDYRTHNYEF